MNINLVYIEHIHQQENYLMEDNKMDTDSIKLQMKYYPVAEKEIETAESELNAIFPGTLKEFYNNVGYGFFNSSLENVNRLLDPLSVRDFRLRQNDFQNYPDIEIYDNFEDNKLIFFEINESALFSIGLIDGRIYYYDTPIADSLNQFFDKFIEDETYYSYVL